jgi:hypothetical protein
MGQGKCMATDGYKRYWIVVRGFDRRMASMSDETSSASDDSHDDDEIQTVTAAPRKPKTTLRAKQFVAEFLVALAVVVTFIWVSFICWGLFSLMEALV